MGKNQNTWSHRTKIIFHPTRVILLWQKNVRGTRNASLAGDRYNGHSLLLWMWFLNVWDNVPIDLNSVCKQYFTCMCFLGFIWYNKTFIACRFRKYENLFTHEYYITPRALPSGNMILLGESIFIFPSPACNKCIILFPV